LWQHLEKGVTADKYAAVCEKLGLKGHKFVLKKIHYSFEHNSDDKKIMPYIAVLDIVVSKVIKKKILKNETYFTQF